MGAVWSSMWLATSEVLRSLVYHIAYATELMQETQF